MADEQHTRLLGRTTAAPILPGPFLGHNTPDCLRENLPRDRVSSEARNAGTPGMETKKQHSSTLYSRWALAFNNLATHRVVDAVVYSSSLKAVFLHLAVVGRLSVKRSLVFFTSHPSSASFENQAL